MASLNAHLRQPEQHARLPFHPECPLCRRERLVGSLPSDALVSRRTQAALAAGVLALSAAAPVGAYAQEPDQVTEGAAPEEIDGADPTHDPDFDPGGESTDLPFDAPPTTEVAAPPDPEDPDAGPLEQEPATDIDAPVADAGDEPAPEAPSQTVTPSPATPAPDAPNPSQPPTATPTPTPTPAVDAPASSGASGSAGADADGNDAAPAGKHQKKNERDTAKDPSSNTGRAAPETTVAPAPEPAAPATPPAEPTAAAAQNTPAPVVAVARGSRAQPGDRTHVVLRGESLWSIAADHLGGQPTVARIAREVNRLWELNRERIGTGSPDLLMVGTRLTLQ
jgi:hypothetical protein